MRTLIPHLALSSWHLAFSPSIASPERGKTVPPTAELLSPSLTWEIKGQVLKCRLKVADDVTKARAGATSGCECSPDTNLSNLRDTRVVVGFVIMAFRSLLLCEDEATARLVGRVFRDLGVDMEHFTGGDIAVEKIKQGSFDAVVVDDADPTGAALVLEAARSLTSSKKCLGIVLAHSQTSLGVAFGAGTHLVIYKPIAVERVRSGLTAVRNLMGRKHRRQSPRVRVEIEATLSREGKAKRHAVIIDLSEGGAALRMDGSLAASEPINLACVLPGTSNPLSAKAEIVWRDAQGWLGVRFVDLAGESQRVLRDWVNSNSRTRNQISMQTKR